MAHDLRLFREQRGQTGHDVAKIINCARSSVSRLETGQAKLEDRQAAVLDEEWNTGGHFTYQLWYARLGHNPNWLQEHLDIEARSSVIKTYEALVVPGLLQTPEYARALFAADGVADVEGDVERRMSRQAILTKNPPPQLWVLLSENALDWPIGSPKVMRLQLAGLLEASEQPHIGIRVLPRSAGAHAGTTGSFKIMSTDSGDIVYTDSPGGGRLVPSVAEVRSYALRYDRIGQHALPEGASRDKIKQAMEATQ
ncbi:MAG TPA: helix-turn-helix transcriptional regulator [Streptosporangiaceae bacterium]